MRSAPASLNQKREGSSRGSDDIKAASEVDVDGLYFVEVDSEDGLGRLGFGCRLACEALEATLINEKKTLLPTVGGFVFEQA